MPTDSLSNHLICPQPPSGAVSNTRPVARNARATHRRHVPPPPRPSIGAPTLPVRCLWGCC